MALIKCDECGRDISSKAPNCPGCGIPIAAVFSPPPPAQITIKQGAGCGTVILWGAVLIAAALLVLYIIGSSRTSGPRYQSSSQPARTPISPQSNWRLVGEQGDMRFVYISPTYSDNKSEYHMAVATLCARKTHCYVNFWQDESKTPTRLPLNDAQIEAQVAGYVQNTVTGKHHWGWRCELFPGTPADQCF